MKQLSLQAPAKINPRLKITGLRANGFHELDMIMVPLEFADQLTLTEIPTGIELLLSGDLPSNDSGMCGEKNLAFRAAKLFQENFSITKGVRIELLKRIPSGAGLGGGSSDAASVLLGLNQLWEVKAPASELARLAACLGSDVPFFCYAQACSVSGVGDEVVPLAKYPNFHVLLVRPNFSVSTPWAYQVFDKMHDLKTPKEGVFHLTVAGAGVRGSTLFSSPREVVQALENDLEKAVFSAHPELGEIKAKLQDLGALGALMSGSGSVVFGIFADESSLMIAQKDLQSRAYQVVATQTRSGNGSCA